MTGNTISQPPLREIDERQNDGVRVRWLADFAFDPPEHFIEVNDTKTGGEFRLKVLQSDPPKEVFHHPFAYAAHNGIDTGEPARGFASMPENPQFS